MRAILDRITRRLANEPAVIIALIIVVIRALGADVDLTQTADLAEQLQQQLDVILGLGVVRQSVDGPQTRRKRAHEQWIRSDTTPPDPVAISDGHGDEDAQ